MSHHRQQTVNWIHCQQQAIIPISSEREYLSLSLRLDKEQLNSCFIAL